MPDHSSSMGETQPVATSPWNSLAAADSASALSPNPPAAALERDVSGGLHGARFTVEGLHAKGGLGQISLAHDNQLNRPVALKEIRPERRDAPTRRRFLNEAEITGQLEHPGIVPIYALEKDSAGEPYYVMRFIQGRPMSEAIRLYHARCRDEPGGSLLEIRQLLQRFVSVCQTMAYVHSKGVIHRDLKPANVMLGDYGETLIVDWGLAKRTVGRDPDSESNAATGVSVRRSRDSVEANVEVGRTEHFAIDVTRPGTALGTPAYIAPEQARGEWAIVGPPADIFSLGAILYQLLTARPPFMGESMPAIMEDARTCKFAPPHAIQADTPKALEAICLKAMAARPEDRYPSAAAVADDVTRWLADEPVHAYVEPWTQRARRWMRRHRTLVTSTTAVLIVVTVALAAGLAVVAALYHDLNHANADLAAAVRRETAEHARAEKNAAEAQTSAEAAQRSAAAANDSEADKEAAFQFVINDVLAAARPIGQEGGLGVEVTVRKALDAASPRIGWRFLGRPRAEGLTRAALGQTYRYLGEYKAEIRELERAYELYRQSYGPEHPETLMIANNLGLAYLHDAQFAKCIPLLEQTLVKRRQELGLEHRDTLVSMSNLAVAYHDAGEIAKALALHEEALALSKEALGPDDPDTLITLRNLANMYRDIGQLTRAVTLFEEQVAAMRQELGADHPDTLIAMNNLALTYKAAGQFAKAIPLYEETVQRRSATLGAEHPHTLSSMNNLARAYQQAGQLAKALVLYEQIVPKMQAALGPDHPDAVTTLNNLGLAYYGAGQKAKALPLFEEALARRTATLGPDHPLTLQSVNTVATAYQQAGQTPKALPLLEKTLARQRERLGDDHPDTLTTMSNLAIAYEDNKQLDKALPLYQETIERRTAKLGRDHPDTLLAMNNLAVTYHTTRQYDKAIALFEETLALRKRKLGPDHLDTLTTMFQLGVSYFASKQPDKAEPLLLAAYEGVARRQPQLRLQLAQQIVNFYETLHRKPEADKWRKVLEKERPN